MSSQVRPWGARAQRKLWCCSLAWRRAPSRSGSTFPTDPSRSPSPAARRSLGWPAFGSPRACSEAWRLLLLGPLAAGASCPPSLLGPSCPSRQRALLSLGCRNVLSIPEMRAFMWEPIVTQPPSRNHHYRLLAFFLVSLNYSSQDA